MGVLVLVVVAVADFPGRVDEGRGPRRSASEECLRVEVGNRCFFTGGERDLLAVDTVDLDLDGLRE